MLPAGLTAQTTTLMMRSGTTITFRMSLPSIARATAFVDAGADMIFPEGLKSAEDFGAFAAAMKGYGSDRGPYLLANMTEFGKTPIMAIERFEQLGYDCVIWPVTTLRSAMGEVTRLLADLKRDGHVETHLDRMQTRQDLYAALRYTPGTEWRYPAPAGSD